MSEEEMVTITGKLRTESGKGYCRRLRVDGKIPGNILDKTKSTMIELESKWLSKAWKSGKKFKLALEGEKEVAVRIQELQINPVKRSAVHVDLMYL